MKTIWKFPLKAADSFVAEMPKGAQILTAQMQHGIAQMWAVVDPETEIEQRTFYVRGTGHPMGDADGARYVATFQLDHGGLVFHLFEKGNVQ